jgi:hypothetical protein
MLISRTVALVVEGQTRGDLVYFNGTEWVRLPTGTAGQVLSTDGDVPQWITVASGGSDRYRFSGSRPNLDPPITLTIPNFFPFTGNKAIEINAALKFYPVLGTHSATFETFCLRTLITSAGVEKDARVIEVERDSDAITNFGALTFTQDGTNLLVSVVFADGGAVDYRISFIEA